MFCVPILASFWCFFVFCFYFFKLQIITKKKKKSTQLSIDSLDLSANCSLLFLSPKIEFYINIKES